MAPELDHGLGWIPWKMAGHEAPWFLDDGAYWAWRNDEPTIPLAAFWERLA